MRVSLTPVLTYNQIAISPKWKSVLMLRITPNVADVRSRRPVTESPRLKCFASALVLALSACAGGESRVRSDKPTSFASAALQRGTAPVVSPG
jgi:hypothetical protein